MAMRLISLREAGCNFMMRSSFYGWLFVFIKADGGRCGAGFGFLAHGAPVGSGGADGDQNTQNTADNGCPQPEAVVLLQPGGKPQEETGGQQNG